MPWPRSLVRLSRFGPATSDYSPLKLVILVVRGSLILPVHAHLVNPLIEATFRLGFRPWRVSPVLTLTRRSQSATDTDGRICNESRRKNHVDRKSGLAQIVVDLVSGAIVRRKNELIHHEAVLAALRRTLTIWPSFFRCDADPAALAKYVLALIKKDKPEKELRQSMQSQMEVFLQNETPGFIDLLFETVENRRYLQHTPTTPDKPAPIVKSELPDPSEEPAVDGVADSTTPTRLPVPSDVTHSDHEPPLHAGRRRASSERELSAGTRGRRRHSRSPVHRRRNASRNRYRSRSSRSRSPPSSGHYRPTRSSRSRSRSPYARRAGRTHRPRSFSPPNNALEDDGPSPYLPSTTAKRPRCRDYDEKGFCMRGDLCKFDHGNDAVVLEDTVVPGAAAGVPAYQPSSVNSVYAEPYVPTGHPPVSLPPLHIPPPGYTPGVNVRKRGLDDHHATYPPAKQSVHDRLGGYNRGHRGGRGTRGRGGRGGGGSHHAGSGSTQIAVRNIPPEMNNIAHLNNHFARFGSLVNIQVQFEDDPGSALVSFSNPEDAGTAYNSPDAVLSNRFIKMHFYYNRDESHKFGGHKPNPRQEMPVEASEKTPEEIEAQEKRKAEEKAAVS